MRRDGHSGHSAATLYGADMDLRDCLVVGISQSGRTPDVMDYVTEARRREAFTVAITRDAADLTPRRQSADHAVVCDSDGGRA